jgi:BirA family transcriptional regulator, biotin operon repressor / biotin---[acetyl-CoA-carboxylase] ligase
VSPGAGPGALGHPRLHYRLVDSTNERARALALAGAPHGTLVTTSEQSAGRGRQGRTWAAPAGSSLLMSLLVRWPEAAPAPGLLPLLAGVATCEAIGGDLLIKWPNDIVVARGDGGLAKLAGILVEGRPQERWAVLGIGVNVAVELDQLPGELPDRAATLGRRPEDVEPLLGELLSALSRRLSQPAVGLLADWNARDALRGRRIGWGAPGSATHTGEGVARGVDGAGRLIVALDSGGQTTLEAGEVHLAPGAGPAA